MILQKYRRFDQEKLFEFLKDACLKESIYWTERKSYPDIDDLVKSNERDEMVSYMLEICEREDMSLNVETFSLSVSLLDRFLSSFKVKSKYLECLTVACLYIACKVKEEDEKISITSEFLVDCGCKCSIAELLRMELMILTKFEWTVNDLTAIDFLYIYHALLVSSYNNQTNSSSQQQQQQINDSTKNKWKVIKTPNHHSKNEKADSFFLPSDLDFLYLLEHKLKQCLCASELTTTYKPRVLAYTLLQIQIEKQFATNNENENNTTATANATNNNNSKNSKIFEMMNQLKQSAKLNDDNLNECKEKVIEHLASLDANKTLLDRYLDEYYFDIARGYKSISAGLFLASTPLSATVTSHLSAIKEEDEEEENADDDMKQQQQQQQPQHKDNNKILSTISTNISTTNHSNSSISFPTLKLINSNEASSNNNNNNESLNLNYENELNEEGDATAETTTATATANAKAATAMNNLQEKIGSIGLFTYADILTGRHDQQQKRKLSENSNTDEEYDCDIENRLC